MWDEPSGPYLSPRAPGETDAWTEAATRAGRTGIQLIREVADTVPPPDVANALQLPAGASAPLAQPKKIKGGAVTLLADMGYVVREALDDISVRGATEPEAELLGLPAGAPVIVVFRTAVSKSDVPFEATVMVMVPEGRHPRYPLSAG